MKILHIFKNTNEKFSEPFIEFINSKFNNKNHMFIILGQDNRKNKINRENVTFISKSKYLILINEVNKADKVILHALMSPPLTLILFFHTWLLKKCYWVVWGADLYYYKNRDRNIKTNIHEFFRRYVIRNMGGIITHIEGDYELAKEWYGAKGKYYYSFMYPSNLYHEYDLTQTQNFKDDKTYIQIGNSADPSNNHIEVLYKLEMYKDLNIEIICPLSYGNSEYRDNVIHEGKEIFGDKFNPLIEFLPFDDYLNLLSKIDIAIFNHKRQQAMGNITTLLGLGKKVYIRDDITTWDFCECHELKVYRTNGGFDDLFIKMDQNSMQKNIIKVKSHFSEEKLVKDWSRIFNE